MEAAAVDTEMLVTIAGKSQEVPSIQKPQDGAPSYRSLPDSVWTNIVQHYALGAVAMTDILGLRRVSSWFNNEVLSILFTRQLLNFSRSCKHSERAPEHFIVYFIQGFLARKKLFLKSHKHMRRAMLRAAGLDPRDSNAASDTCLISKPQQPCTLQVIGPSSGIECKMHDLLQAIAFALGPYCFYFGLEYDSIFERTVISDERYWRLLAVAYRVSADTENKTIVSQLEDMLHDLIADARLNSQDCGVMISDCYVLAARRNSPGLIGLLDQLADDQPDLGSTLGSRSVAQNALWESARLGYVSVLSKLLSKKWVFDPTNLSYSLFVAFIIRRDHLSIDIRAQMLESVFEWTTAWRTHDVMDTLLIEIGRKRNLKLLDAVISALKLQHHHSNLEDSTPYYGRGPAEPLLSLAHHENPMEMIHCFFANRQLLLPRLTEDAYKDMRLQTMYQLLNKRLEKSGEAEAHIQILKVVVEHSQDLIEAKHGLQNAVIVNCNDWTLARWDWLAEKLGLDSKCDESYEGHTLGSALMQSAVEKLNVQAVQFLADNGISLIKEATTLEIKESDDSEMEKLDTITRILAQGGQGECTQARTVITTFSASKAMPIKAKRRSVIETSPTMRVSSTVTRMAHVPRPKSLKRILPGIGKRQRSKSGVKSSTIVTTQSVSSRSSVTG